MVMLPDVPVCYWHRAVPWGNRLAVAMLSALPPWGPAVFG